MLAADGAGELDLDDASTTAAGRPTAWLFGNEAWGLPDELAALADHRVRIPIHGRAESLNLATAAAVCLYASARAQRRPLTRAGPLRRTDGLACVRRRPWGPRGRSRHARTRCPTAWCSRTPTATVTAGQRRGRRLLGARRRGGPAARRRGARSRTRTATDWYACTGPYDGLATRTAVTEQSWCLSDGTEVLVTARILRDAPARPGRPGRGRRCARPRAGPGSTASAPTWSPPSPTSCARR